MAKPKPPDSAQRLQQALAAAGLEGAQIQPTDASGLSVAHGSVWQKVSVADVADLQDIEVQVPAQARARLDGDGAVLAVELTQPSSEDLEEVISFVRGLAKRGEIAGRGGGAGGAGRDARKLPSRRPTHELITSEDGTRRLLRRGFSGT